MLNRIFRIKLNKQDIVDLIPKTHQLAWAAGLVFLFLATYYGYYAIDAYRNARQLAALVEPLKKSASSRDWAQTKELLDGASIYANDLERDIDSLYPFTLIPGVSSEVMATRSLIAAGKLSIASAKSVAEWVAQVPLLSEAEFSSFSELTARDKAELLKQISDSTELWERVANQTSLSLIFLQDAHSATRLSFINSKASQLSEKLLVGQTVFNQIAPWIAVAPKVLGYPNEKTYLLLLQNNTELRPTGGFIGTYGVLKIHNAEVVSFTTDNVYNLDEPAKVFNEKVPPLPLQKYIKQSQWFFRDSNWDPNFPSSARNAIQFYKDERGPIRNFDGVIALTPTFVEEILSVLGPVFVDDKEFTSENLIEELAYHVELGFRDEGINIYNRKQIIDDAAQELKEKLFSLTVDQLRLLVPIVLDGLSERHLMAYFEDSNVQKMAEQMNWAGQIIQTQGDYLFVVDANLGSLKSDPAINRTINYTVKPGSGGKLNATVTISYEHTGDFDWKTTRYRTYTRVYVPRGSTLVSAKGNEEPVAITDEHNKTVFGTFISIEPLTTETLSFTYALPKDLAAKVALGNYSLYIQKQGGTVPHVMEFDLSMPFDIKAVLPGNIIKTKGNSGAHGVWDLGVDRIITIQSK